MKTKDMIDEIYNHLVQHHKLYKQGSIEQEKAYLVLDQILDTFMARGYKDKLGYPAIVYDMVNSFTEGDLQAFYGEKAQLHICSYLVDHLSEDEKSRICEAVKQEGFKGQLVAGLKQYINTHCPLKIETVSFAEPVKQVEKTTSLTKQRLLVLSLGVLMIGVIIIAAAFGSGTASADLKAESTKIKKELEIVQKEKEALEKENAALIKEKEALEKAIAEFRNMNIDSDMETANPESEFPMQYQLTDTYILRETTSTSSKRLAQMDAGTEVTLYSREEDGWYRVGLQDGNEGYMRLGELKQE